MNRNLFRLRQLALPGVLLAHGVGLLALSQRSPTVHERIETGTLTVRMIEPARPQPSPLLPPPPPPPRPKAPVPPRETPPVPTSSPPVALVTTVSGTPAAVVPEVVPVPVPVQAAPAPVPIPGPVVPAAPVVRPPPPPPPPSEPVLPPAFDAAYLQNPAPAYPNVSRRLGEEGVTVLRVHVEPSGVADQLEVRTSSGHVRLDEAALDAVRRWRFVPARQGERPIAAWVLVPIRFTLGR